MNKNTTICKYKIINRLTNACIYNATLRKKTNIKRYNGIVNHPDNHYTLSYFFPDSV